MATVRIQLEVDGAPSGCHREVKDGGTVTTLCAKPGECLDCMIRQFKNYMDQQNWKTNIAVIEHPEGVKDDVVSGLRTGSFA